MALVQAIPQNGYSQSLSQKTTFFSCNHRDSFSIPLDSLRWVRAQENYVQFCWVQEGLLRTTLLRNTLSVICKQLPESFIQTHRSFWINFDHLVSLERRIVSKGMDAQMDRVPYTVPVSKSYTRTLKARVKEQKPQLL
ncbi:MAG: LytTR family transcriptional regulator DNA-binding domain-containing protein [Bacteroidota bacterium]